MLVRVGKTLCALLVALLACYGVRFGPPPKSEEALRHDCAVGSGQLVCARPAHTRDEWVSLPLARRRFASGSLQRLSDRDLNTGESYFLLCKPEDPSPAVKAVHDWMLEVFQQGGRRHH
jgi:hypothetical protein